MLMSTSRLLASLSTLFTHTPQWLMGVCDVLAGVYLNDWASWSQTGPLTIDMGSSSIGTDGSSARSAPAGSRFPHVSLTTDWGDWLLDGA
jgi:hypothetical protein